jgi:hypothetical protein
MHCQKVASQTNLKATSIRCNEPISDEVFRPVLPPGVRVREHFGTPHEADHITGGEAGRLMYEQFDGTHRRALGLDNAAVPVPLNAGTPMNAAPKRDSPWSRIAVGAGLACLVGALVALRRRGR